MTQRHTQLFAGLLALVLTACSTPHTLELRLDEADYRQASLAGSAGSDHPEPMRFWADEDAQLFLNGSQDKTPLTVTGERLNILALSGGGANGAFGAGVVNGLHDSGQLLDYTVVTGISAGALIAPFAFVGGERIQQIEAVMLGIDDKMVLGKRNLLNTLLKDAFTNGHKLYEFIEDNFDSTMIEEIAEQHRQGRRLLIGTTHFDSGELVVWNLGQIASSELPNRARLIHQVLAASASIPGVFPPQFIEVEHQGERFEELHVDGGLAEQVFFDAGQIDYRQISQVLGLSQAPQVHVVRNGALTMPYSPTKDKGVALLNRSLKSLTIQQTRGDLFRMLYFSEVGGLDLAFAYVGDDFDATKASKAMFDTQYMTALYRYGYRKAVQGTLWTTEVP
ncbi:patatin-like phospholipase family protein [Ferrimonas balearica]|uniref:patatin-like phospholipase family protein n=1 Tax=Ferrimonas balearica TaxID=44012 RepID=UPI001C99DD17|nr:patatin-like phospholipase family protein [Ferrimonas balearica]MBY5992576.1 patatin-like phospholipase family protein [Ferrimonas balearica]